MQFIRFRRIKTVALITITMLGLSVTGCSKIPFENQPTIGYPASTHQTDHKTDTIPETLSITHPLTKPTPNFRLDERPLSLSLSRDHTSNISPPIIERGQNRGVVDNRFSTAYYINLWDRIRDQFQAQFAGKQPLSKRANQRIQYHRDNYRTHARYLNAILQRSEPYLYYIVEQLEARGMPTELALLPIIESAYDPFAYSHGQAAGLWQFIPETGAMYGLEQNWWYDGRRDLLASTQAAISYLDRLHRQFDNDWLLALAAYNCGSGAVRRSIKRNQRQGKATDYWSLQLPKETRHYVPKLLAVRDLLLHQEQYGFKIKPIANQPAFAIVTTDQQIPLHDAAKIANIPFSELRRLNPGFKRRITAPNGPHHLLIPIDQSEHFARSIKHYTADANALWHRHKVEKGDNLSELAVKYGTSIAAIRQANSLKHDRIVINQSLLIPKTTTIE